MEKTTQTEQQQYNRFIEMKKNFIAKFEELKPKRKQIIKDYERAKEEAKFSFEKWKTEQAKIQHIRGLKI